MPFAPLGANPATDAAAVIITTVLVLAPLVWLASRITLPRGAATVHLAIVVTHLLGLDGFNRWPLIVAALAGGGAAEAMRVLASRRDTVGLAAFGGAVAAAVWTAFFVTTAVLYSLDTEAELRTGPLVLAVVGGIGLGCLLAPAPMNAPIDLQ